MNGLDIALLVVLFFFFIRGIFRGFVKEVTSTAALILGLVLASSYYPYLAKYLESFRQLTGYREVVAFLVLFFVIFFLISLLGILVDKVIKVAVSNVTNGLLGALVALIKGVLMAAVVLMVATTFIRPDTPLFNDSAAWPYLKMVARTVKEFVPQELQQALENKSGLIPGNIKDILPEGRSPNQKEIPEWKPVKPESDRENSPAWPGSTGR